MCLIVIIDKHSNGRWRVPIRNGIAPALSKTFTRKTDAINSYRININNKFNSLHPKSDF